MAKKKKDMGMDKVDEEQEFKIRTLEERTKNQNKIEALVALCCLASIINLLLFAMTIYINGHPK